MKITGELLKTERIKKNLSIADVANALKLSNKIVSAIESGNLSELPSKTFIRGFVGSYANHLKLDTQLILRQFHEEMGTTQPTQKKKSVLNTSPNESSSEKINQKAETSLKHVPSANLGLDQDHRKKTILYISVACGLLGLILIINNTIDKYQNEAVVDKNNLEQIQPINTAAKDQVVTPTGANATLISTNPEAPISSTGADGAIQKDQQKNNDVATTNEVASSIPEDFEPSAAKPVEVIVEAKVETEFYYAKGNGKNFIRVKLAPKEMQILRSSLGLYIKADDGSQFNLILNGVDKGPASSANKPVRLTF